MLTVATMLNTKAISRNGTIALNRGGGMKSFKKFIQENSLHVFDIDDTLFHHPAKIRVMRGKKEVTRLSSGEYAKHTLPKGHKYDYSEFRSSQHFHDTAKPIPHMVNKLKVLHKNPKNKIIMNTARGDMDDREKFLDKFRKHGIDIDKIHIHRAGNQNISGPEAKANITHKEIMKGNYKHVHMYDDHEENLNSFMNLKDKHPDIKFKAHHIKPKT